MWPSLGTFTLLFPVLLIIIKIKVLTVNIIIGLKLEDGKRIRSKSFIKK